jgi:hypothetical protein
MFVAAGFKKFYCCFFLGRDLMKSRPSITWIVAVAMSVSAVAAHAAQRVAYDMDTNTGTAVSDVSGLGPALDAVIQGDASVVFDTTRNSMVLDTGSIGNGAWSAYDAKLDTGTGGFTMAAWVKTSNNATFQQMIGRGPFAERIFNQWGSGALLAVSNAIEAEGAFLTQDFGPGGGPDGMWHHVAASLDTSTGLVTSYYDGVPFGPAALLNAGNPQPISGVAARGEGFQMAGRSLDGLDAFPNSQLDDVVFWDGAANPNLIAQIASGAVSALDIPDITVPEPTAITLLAWAAAVLLLGRRRN